MLENFQPGMSLVWDLIWQSSVLLAGGLAASLALRVHPARAHRVLLLTMIAALCTPLLAQGIRYGGWGLLRQPDAMGAAVQPTSSRERDTVTSPIVRGAQRLPDPGKIHTLFGQERTLDPDRAATAVAAGVPTPDESRSDGAVGSGWQFSKPAWQQIMLIFWAVLSGLAISRFLASLVRGLRLVRSAATARDLGLDRVISQAISRLGLAVRPELRTTQSVRCPSVWSWGQQPILLVPARLQEQDKAIDWVAIFCHELAHWRRDHLASLAAELLVCMLPWNPLAWWARARLAQLAELACDDWVLACGSEGTDYAASLLELVPQRGHALALAAVSSQSGLAGRMQHILGDRRSSPTIGTGWALLALACTMLASSALALAQAGSAPAGEPKARNAVTSPPNVQPRKEPGGMKRTVHLTVQGPDGKPVANAMVLWLGASKSALARGALPHDDPERMGPRFKVLAKAQTDAQGHQDMSAEFDSGDDSPTQFIVTAPGFGICPHIVQETLAESTVKMTLAPEVLIHGRLLTPAGAPAAGVRVLLNGFHNDAMNHSEGIYTGLGQTDEELPVYWPRPRKTDSDGRVTIEGVPREFYASLSFWHPDFAVDEVTVSTVADGSLSPGLKAFEIVPVKPTFTHTLEPARPVQGRVTDRHTGKPIAGMVVEMTPMRSHGGMPFLGRTDADGQFRISGHQANLMYITTVHPRADSGYLAASDQHQGWPAGAKFLEVNFALEKGRLIQGRVIDCDSRQPVEGAAVMYQPASKNPNNKPDFDLRNTVLAARDGTFRITGLPGDGMLVAEVPDPDAVRAPVKGTMYGMTAYPHGSVTVHMPGDGEPKPVEIAVRKGVTMETRVVDPGGQVVREVVAFFPGIHACLIDVWNQGQEFADGIVRIRGADPERTYRVCFIKPDRKLGAVAELKYDGKAAGPIEVRLQPTASVHGKVATPGGSSSEGCQVYALLVLSKDRKEVSVREFFNRDLVEFYANVLGHRNMRFENERTGSTGEFTLDALIPGANFYVTAAEGGGREARVAVPDLKPGEDRDLGTLVLKERQP